MCAKNPPGPQWQYGQHVYHCAWRTLRNPCGRCVKKSLGFVPVHETCDLTNLSKLLTLVLQTFSFEARLYIRTTFIKKQRRSL